MGNTVRLSTSAAESDNVMNIFKFNLVLLLSYHVFPCYDALLAHVARLLVSKHMKQSRMTKDISSSDWSSSVSSHATVRTRNALYNCILCGNVQCGEAQAATGAPSWIPSLGFLTVP